jgi:hypothetical protein
MPLDSGTRLGPYEITGSLGAGGRGEVYLAEPARIDVVLNWLEELKTRVPTQ